MHDITINAIREYTGLNRKQFAERYGIPYRTVEDWEHGRRECPVYVKRLLAESVGLLPKQTPVD